VAVVTTAVVLGVVGLVAAVLVHLWRGPRADADEYVSAETLRDIDERVDRCGWTDGPRWRFPA
jgi:hypothetical protein